MGFLSIINNYTLRSCISVTITRLVLERKYSNETTASGEVCPKPDISIEEEKVNIHMYTCVPLITEEIVKANTSFIFYVDTGWRI